MITTDKSRCLKVGLIGLACCPNHRLGYVNTCIWPTGSGLGPLRGGIVPHHGVGIVGSQRTVCNERDRYSARLTGAQTYDNVVRCRLYSKDSAELCATSILRSLVKLTPSHVVDIRTAIPGM